jgi:hypothetical protein
MEKKVESNLLRSYTINLLKIIGNTNTGIHRKRKLIKARIKNYTKTQRKQII